MRSATWLITLLVGCSAPEPVVEPDAGEVETPCVEAPTLIDFGEVPTGKLAQRQVVLNNPGPLNAEISVSLGQPPFAVSSSRSVIPPEEQATLRVDFTPPDGQLRVGSVRFSGGVRCPLTTIQLRGLGSGSVVAPELVDFGAVPLQMRATATLVLTNTRRVATTVTLVDLARSPSFIVPTTVELQPSSTTEVELSITPLLAGPAETTLLLTSTAGDMARITVAAMGGLPMARLRTSFDLPHLPVQFPLTRQVRIFNDGIGDLHLRSVRVLSANPITTANELTLRFPEFVSAGLSATADIQLMAFTTGPREWTLELETNEPGRERIELRITAQVEVLAPCAETAITVPQGQVSIPSGGTPTTVDLQFANGSTHPCLIDNLQARHPSDWTFGPLDEQLLLPAGGAAVRTFGVSSSGSARLSFTPMRFPMRESWVDVFAAP